MDVDFGRTAADYARHRAGLPSRFTEFFEEWIGPLRGRRVLDLGSGTGAAARPLAAAGARVVALDPARPMLVEQRERAWVEGLEIACVVGRAEATGLRAASFDLVTAVQCWHWFDAPRAAREAARLLRPGGLCVLASFDWMPLPGSVPELSEHLVLQHNPAWHLGGGNGLHPEYARDLEAAGFELARSDVSDLEVPYSHEGWRGRMRASAGVGASLDPAGVARFDAELAAQLAAHFPVEPLQVPHRLFLVAARA